MELLFLLKSSKLIKPKRMMKERYHSVPLFFSRVFLTKML